MPVDGDCWGVVCALRHDVRLLQTDGEPELLAGMGELTDKLLQAILCV